MSKQSFRLNKTHRADICSAILANWELQNPEPKISQQQLDILITNVVMAYAKQVDVIKLNDVYNYALSLCVGRLHSISVGSCIQNELNVRVMNPQGEERSFTSIPILTETLYRLNLNHYIPTRGTLSRIYVDEEGLVNLGYSHQTNRIFHPKQDVQTVVENLPSGVQAEIQNAIDERYLQKGISVNIAVAGFHSCANPIEISSNHPYFLEERLVRRKLNIWTKERNQLRKEVMDTLEQFNTSKQLIEGWPEVEGYMPPHMADMSVINLPAVSINRLNERLALNP